MWEDRSVVSEGSVVDLVDKDTKKSDSLITHVRLELRLDVEDEGRGDGGEQASLLTLVGTHPRKLEVKTHEDQSGVQILIVLLHELSIVLLSLLAVIIIELTPKILLGGQHILFLTASWS